MGNHKRLPLYALLIYYYLGVAYRCFTIKIVRVLPENKVPKKNGPKTEEVLKTSEVWYFIFPQVPKDKVLHYV